MTDIKPVAWTSKKGLRHLATMGFLTVGKREDQERKTPLYGPEAADEITRLRQLLSEAEKRERETRAKALEEAASIVDAVSHEGLHNSMWRCRFERVAADIRALQSEER